MCVQARIFADACFSGACTFAGEAAARPITASDASPPPEPPNPGFEPPAGDIANAAGPPPEIPTADPGAAPKTTTPSIAAAPDPGWRSYFTMSDASAPVSSVAAAQSAGERLLPPSEREEPRPHFPPARLEIVVLHPDPGPGPEIHRQCPPAANHSQRTAKPASKALSFTRRTRNLNRWRAPRLPLRQSLGRHRGGLTRLTSVRAEEPPGAGSGLVRILARWRSPDAPRGAGATTAAAGKVSRDR